MKNIYVYRDRGVGLFSFKQLCRALSHHFPSLEVIPIDAKKVIQGGWESDARLFAMPGGRDLPYCQKLQGAGNARIRHYVKSGGCYLGFCAGAYYGASAVCFAQGTPFEVVGTRELSFFKGVATGPLFRSDAFSYGPGGGADDKGASGVQIRLGTHLLHAYYNGGCGFLNAENDPNCEIMGWYEPLNLPAIVRCQCGLGWAVLSGVHLEFDPCDLSEKTPRDVKEILLKSKEIQRVILKELLQTATCGDAISPGSLTGTLGSPVKILNRLPKESTDLIQNPIAAKRMTAT